MTKKTSLKLVVAVTVLTGTSFSAASFGPRPSSSCRPASPHCAQPSQPFWFYLSRHPSVYDRLAAETRTTFPSPDAISGCPLLMGCHYLHAVIDECMRAAPPFLGTSWRKPYADMAGLFVVDDRETPRTIVSVNPYCPMHNETYFPEPYAFRPERWLKPERVVESPEYE